jgi:hypothetical protein
VSVEETTVHFIKITDFSSQKAVYFGNINAFEFKYEGLAEYFTSLLPVHNYYGHGP